MTKGCTKSVHLDKARLVDLSPDQLMMESVEELPI